MNPISAVENPAPPRPRRPARPTSYGPPHPPASPWLRRKPPRWAPPPGRRATPARAPSHQRPAHGNRRPERPALPYFCRTRCRRSMQTPKEPSATNWGLEGKTAWNCHALTRPDRANPPKMNERTLPYPPHPVNEIWAACAARRTGGAALPHQRTENGEQRIENREQNAPAGRRVGSWDGKTKHPSL